MGREEPCLVCAAVAADWHQQDPFLALSTHRGFVKYLFYFSAGRCWRHANKCIGFEVFPPLTTQILSQCSSRACLVVVGGGLHGVLPRACSQPLSQQSHVDPRLEGQLK